MQEEAESEKHFSIDPVLTTKNADSQSKDLDQATAPLSPKESSFPAERSIEIHEVSKSPLHAANDCHGTGTCADAAHPRRVGYDVETHEVDPEGGIDWKPGFRDQFPWVGFCSFLTVLVATAMACAILVTSDERLVKQ